MPGVPLLRHDEFGPLCANIRQGGWLASLRNAMERDRQRPPRMPITCQPYRLSTQHPSSVIHHDRHKCYKERHLS